MVDNSVTSQMIDFEPLGRRAQCASSDSILDCARHVGAGISSVCGGTGTCAKCKIKIIFGAVSEPTQTEKEIFSAADLKAGWRLACRVYPLGNVKVSVPLESMTTSQRTQFEGQDTFTASEPPVKIYHVNLAAPSLLDQQADSERLIAALNNQHDLNCDRIDFKLLQNLSKNLRDSKWSLEAAVRKDEVVGVFFHPHQAVGLALDLGTTKIAGYLVDLNSGQTLAAKGILNPQVSYGEDVISRIDIAERSLNKSSVMQNLVVSAIDELAAELCEKVGLKKEQILEAVVVANTAMHHLFLGLPVRQLASSPYVPAVSHSLDVKARELGLKFAAGSYMHVLPNIAGFVGADHISMLLATDILKAHGPMLSIDIGTNTEVSILFNRNLTTVSCASGPAFEGGSITHGMRAASGAIERVRISADRVEYQTIDNVPPVGICGSGIIDLMAQMHIAGIIDNSGRMKKDHALVRESSDGIEFLLVPESGKDGHPAITFTQQDVRQLQLGKGAIRTGIQMLLDASACAEEKIKHVNIAGAFGSYIDVTSAIEIGMLPSLPLSTYKQVGNAAGMGAKRALISMSYRRQALTIAAKIKYLELAALPGFNRTFTTTMSLGKYRLHEGKKEEIE